MKRNIHNEPHGMMPMSFNKEDAGGDMPGFDYLAGDGVARLPAENSRAVIRLLDQLGNAMIVDSDDDLAEGDSSIPPVYTYWGQFIDHDITLNTDRNLSDENSGQLSQFNINSDDFMPLSASFVRDNLQNGRSMKLDLDSVYGEGPDKHTEDAQLYCDDDDLNAVCPDILGALKIGEAEAATAGVVPPPDPNDRFRDLPREPVSDTQKRMGAAIVGDARNDENLLIAQFHTAFLRFHNRALSELQDYSSARAHTKLHYQWLVVNDFLKTVADPDVVDAVLQGDTRLGYQGNFMPVEFSAAAYRFGHSMVRPSYDYNENFGRGDAALRDSASFRQLFEFTGNHAENELVNQGRLPFNWIADWNRLALRSDRLDDGKPERFGRKIDTRLATPLGVMENEGKEGTEALRKLMKNLARRNLRRGYLLQVPTGQAMADIAGVAALSDADLLQNVEKGARSEIEQALKSDDNLLLRSTPLWFYILKEAEVTQDGERLGLLGSRIVAETLIGLLQYDQDSVLNLHWEPQNSELEGGHSITTISDFLAYAGVL